MYRIWYGYWDVEWDSIGCKYVGDGHTETVEGETLKELNANFTSIRENHDCDKYSPIQFYYIEEY